MTKNGKKVLVCCQDGPGSNKELLRKGLSPPSPVPVLAHEVTTLCAQLYPGDTQQAHPQLAAHQGAQIMDSALSKRELHPTWLQPAKAEAVLSTHGS